MVFGEGRPPIHAREVAVGPRGSPPHDHDFWEFALVTAGSGLHEDLSGVRPLRRGNVYGLRPGAWHRVVGRRGLRVFNLCFGPELLDGELAWAREDEQLGRLLWLGRGATLHGDTRPTARPRALAALRELADLATAKVAPSRGRAVAALLLALDALAEAIVREGVAPLPHPAVRRAVGLLEANLAKAWTLDALADAVRLDASYLSRLTKRELGLPPLAYLARRRVDRAAALLTRTALPIGEVGRRVGWPDPNQFARRFRQIAGCSASTWRKRA